MSLQRQKQQIRQRIRQQRRCLSPSEQRQSASKASRLLTHCFWVFRKKNMAFYYPKEGELDALLALRQAQRRGKRCFLPVISGPKKDRLLFAPVGPRTVFARNRFDIPEPQVTPARCRQAQHMDIILVPLVAFDDAGNRLGFGGGYYDRTLAYLKLRQRFHKPLLVGFAYAFQQVDKVPRQAWDIHLDYIVTEEKVIRCSNTGASECPIG